MNATEMIHHAANAAYNDGLALAKLHDLSGAIISLSMALRYDKRHTQARNLLGLVYFEYGEPVLALREWVISKNYQPDDNRADYYLKEMQPRPDSGSCRCHECGRRCLHIADKGPRRGWSEARAWL